MDEILQRIEACGLLDGNLARYNPDIVRLRYDNVRGTLKRAVWYFEDCGVVF